MRLALVGPDNGSCAIRANAPCRLKGALAMRAQVLKLGMAIWAYYIGNINRIAACGTLSVIHELPLLQGNFELLLISVNLKHWGTKKDVCNEADDRHQSNDSPDIPSSSTQVCIADNPDD